MIHVRTDNRDRQGRSAVELVVAEVLQTGSISLARPDDSISEPSSVASCRRFKCLHSCRIRAVHLRPSSGSRAASRPHGGPNRWAGPRTATRSSWRCWNRPRTGTAWTPDRRLWFVACAFQRAALTRTAEALKIPGFHPHETRHTPASLAIASGADVKVVLQMLGQERDQDARPVRPPLWRPTRCCGRCHGLAEGLSAFCKTDGGC